MKVQFYAKKPAFRRKQWRARFVADNGRILFPSGEGYNNLTDLENAVLLMRLPSDTPVEYLNAGGHLIPGGGGVPRFIGDLHEGARHGRKQVVKR